jgi:hypothetical protein
LIKLYEKAGLNEKLSEKQSYFIAQLNPMNIEARYTEHKEKLLQILTAETCENYLKETESLLCWIKKQL